jgi:hypothetical protein
MRIERNHSNSAARRKKTATAHLCDSQKTEIARAVLCAGSRHVAPQPCESAKGDAKPAKGWWKRLLSPDPPQPRQAQRERLEGLAAYFFTGGDPVAHGVRDISPTGLYVLTGERWYPGTIVRMTLTDRRRPSAERSITVYVSVVRWGNDGVGVEFVLADAKGARGRSADAGGATGAQLKEFMRLLRSGS